MRQLRQFRGGWWEIALIRAAAMCEVDYLAWQWIKFYNLGL